MAIFTLTAAAVVDTALLLALLDRANRQRLVLPLLLIVAGAWLYHSGSALFCPLLFIHVLRYIAPIV